MIFEPDEIKKIAVLTSGGNASGMNAAIRADFSGEHDLPVVGISGTIDNDIFGTD